MDTKISTSSDNASLREAPATLSASHSIPLGGSNAPICCLPAANGEPKSPPLPVALWVPKPKK